MNRIRWTWIGVTLVSLLGCISIGGLSTDASGARAPMAAVTGIACGGERLGLDQILDPIVEDLEAQQIPYARTPANEWRDCSGSFLRLSSEIATACPEQASYLAAPAGVDRYRSGRDNSVTEKPRARTSRGLARWYLTKQRFQPVYYSGITSMDQARKTLEQYRDQIRPGMVLWFARKPSLPGDGVDALVASVNHMATVTSVELGDDGRLKRFEMFHGQSEGKPASVTYNQFWIWPDVYRQRDTYPPLGFWDQYLVGIGSIVPDAGAGAE